MAIILSGKRDYKDDKPSSFLTPVDHQFICQHLIEYDSLLVFSRKWYMI